MQPRSWIWAILWLYLSYISGAEEFCSLEASDEIHAVRGLFTRHAIRAAASVRAFHLDKVDHKVGWVETRNPGVYARNDKVKDPLWQPSRFTESKQKSFIQNTLLAETTTRIGINPSVRQLQTWFIGNTPISTTAEWYTWGEKATFSMSGLTGCTAIFVVTQYGFWAGHIWEADTDFKYGGTGAAGHNGWHKKGTKEPTVKDDPEKEESLRSDKDFQKIALDIVHQPTKYFRGLGFTSLKDLQDRRTKGFIGQNPGADARVFIFSKEKKYGGKETYTHAEHLELIKKELKRNLDGLVIKDIVTQSYWPPPKTARNPYQDGVVILEYAPYEADHVDTTENGKKKEGCVKKARARIWAEPFNRNGEPVLDYIWEYAG